MEMETQSRFIHIHDVASSHSLPLVFFFTFCIFSYRRFCSSIFPSNNPKQKIRKILNSFFFSHGLWRQCVGRSDRILLIFHWGMGGSFFFSHLQKTWARTRVDEVDLYSLMARFFTAWEREMTLSAFACCRVTVKWQMTTTNRRGNHNAAAKYLISRLTYWTVLDLTWLGTVVVVGWPDSDADDLLMWCGAGANLDIEPTFDTGTSRLLYLIRTAAADVIATTTAALYCCGCGCCCCLTRWMQNNLVLDW